MVIYGSMFLQQFISVSVLHILKIIVEHFLTLMTLSKITHIKHHIFNHRSK